MARTMQQAPKAKSTAKRAPSKGATRTRVPTHDAIAERARELFEESGYQPNRDVEFWLEAERQLRDELED